LVVTGLIVIAEGVGITGRAGLLFDLFEVFAFTGVKATLVGFVWYSSLEISDLFYIN